MLSLQEEQFTFSGSAPQTKDNRIEFDYNAWIERSKSSMYTDQDEKNYAPSLHEAVGRHHREMVLKMVQEMPEDAYELSLTDLPELPEVANAMQKTTGAGTAPGIGRKKNKRRKIWRTESLDRGGFLLKIFLPLLSGGREKSFGIPGSPAMASKNALANKERCMENFSAEMVKDPGLSDHSRSNSNKSSSSTGSSR